MKRYSIYDCKNISRVLCALLAVLFFGLLRPAPVFASIGQPVVKTVVIQVGFGLSQHEDSSTRRDMANFLMTSPAVNRENIEKIANDYLTSHLPGNIPVFVWGHGDPGELPHGESTMLLRIDYTVWPQEIDGKSMKIGAMAVHKMRLLAGDHHCFDNNDFDFMPVDSFVVSDDAAQTHRNLEVAIARLLDGFRMINKRPDEK